MVVSCVHRCGWLKDVGSRNVGCWWVAGMLLHDNTQWCLFKSLFNFEVSVCGDLIIVLPWECSLVASQKLSQLEVLFYVGSVHHTNSGIGLCICDLTTSV